MVSMFIPLTPPRTLYPRSPRERRRVPTMDFAPTRANALTNRSNRCNRHFIQRLQSLPCRSRAATFATRDHCRVAACILLLFGYNGQPMALELEVSTAKSCWLPPLLKHRRAAQNPRPRSHSFPDTLPPSSYRSSASDDTFLSSNRSPACNVNSATE